MGNEAVTCCNWFLMKDPDQRPTCEVALDRDSWITQYFSVCAESATEPDLEPDAVSSNAPSGTPRAPLSLVTSPPETPKTVSPAGSPSGGSCAAAASPTSEGVS